MSALLVLVNLLVEGWWGEWVSLQTSWSNLEKESATRSRPILPLKSLGRLQTKVFLLNMFAIYASSLEQAGSLVPIYLRTPLNEFEGSSEGLIRKSNFHTLWKGLLSFLLSSDLIAAIIPNITNLSVRWHNAWMRIDHMPWDGCVFRKCNSVCFLFLKVQMHFLSKIPTKNMLHSVCSYGLISLKVLKISLRSLCTQHKGVCFRINYML